VWLAGLTQLRVACLGIRFLVGCPLIIRLIIQTILLYPSAAVWTDEASNVSRLDPSGTVQVDAEHPSRNRRSSVRSSRRVHHAQPFARPLVKVRRCCIVGRWLRAGSTGTWGSSLAHALSGLRCAVRQVLGELGGGVVRPPSR
jgi:hypothetical protein